MLKCKPNFIQLINRINALWAKCNLFGFLLDFIQLREEGWILNTDYAVRGVSCVLTRKNFKKGSALVETVPSSVSLCSSTQTLMQLNLDFMHELNLHSALSKNSSKQLSSETPCSTACLATRPSSIIIPTRWWWMNDAKACIPLMNFKGCTLFWFLM